MASRRESTVGETERQDLDPLGHSKPLPLVKSFFPMGFPLLMRTGSEDVLGAAALGWGDFSPCFATPPIELRVLVCETAAQPPPAQAPVFRAQGHLLSIVLDQHNGAVCDLDRSFGYAWLTPAVAAEQAFTSFYFLDGMAYTCLGQKHGTALHAACVASNGSGILLVGGPGAGKTSLAWACCRAGLTFVSDDATWLLWNTGQPLLAGKPHRMRFRPEGLELIPELGLLPRLETIKGPRSFEIRTADVPGLAVSGQCRPGKIVFLEREPGQASDLIPADPLETRRRLAALLPLYEASARQRHEASVEWLSRDGAVILRYSSLPQAVSKILSLV